MRVEDNDRGDFDKIDEDYYENDDHNNILNDV